MHEWALAEGVISTIQRVAKEKGLAAVTKASIKLGELQQVEREIFEFALEELKKENQDSLKNLEIEIGIVPCSFRCRACGNKWRFKEKYFDREVQEAIHFVPEVAFAYMRCPNCGSADFEIEDGRGVWIDSITGERKT
jgi:hydrogenase nickel incorporation protein HypA/HybF